MPILTTNRYIVTPHFNIFLTNICITQILHKYKNKSRLVKIIRTNTKIVCPPANHSLLFNTFRPIQYVKCHSCVCICKRLFPKLLFVVVLLYDFIKHMFFYGLYECSPLSEMLRNRISSQASQRKYSGGASGMNSTLLACKYIMPSIVHSLVDAFLPKRVLMQILRWRSQ